jgi:RNA polymerase sigma-70 factor (ECF subfamily)
MDALVEAFASRVFGFLFRLTASRHDAEDLLQEVFVRVVRTLDAYQHHGRFEPWIFRIAANLARDRLRRRRRTGRRLTIGLLGNDSDEADAVGVVDAASASEPVDAGLERAEALDALNAALARLPEAEREAVMLRHFSQMSFREIAEATGVPLGTALARGHRGLHRLRAMLCDADSPGGGRPRRRESPDVVGAKMAE